MDLFAKLTAFDIVILIITIAFIVRGVWIGFVRQISVLIAMFSSFFVAGQLYEVAYSRVLSFMDNRVAAFMLTYAVLFGLIYVVIILLGKGLQKVMSFTLLGWFDRTLGGIFGAIKAVFVASLIFVACAAFFSDKSFFDKSLSYPILETTSEFVMTFINDHNLRSRFFPKDMAIKSEIKNLVKDLKPERKEGETVEGVGGPSFRL